jgi:hypothetical protein
MALKVYERKLSFPNHAAVLKFTWKDGGNLRKLYVMTAGATYDMRNKNFSSESTVFT